MNIVIVSGLVKITDNNIFIKQLSNIARCYNITVQALNADLLSGVRHIQFAVEKAIRSFESGKNTANNLGMEIMLYASGSRQIEKALDLGVKNGENRVAIVLVGENVPDEAAFDIMTLLNSEDASIVDYSDRKKEDLLKLFNITAAELEAVGEDKIPELVLERVALVDVMK
ncbi:MAG TPA: KEOPS complex subunit Cgi121 [Candidatus Nanoarchaeia archaeon]|nr:KEOPS complex subunit Cgi121 [Candidatus Nanoarchaeia archaeon]